MRLGPLLKPCVLCPFSLLGPASPCNSTTLYACRIGSIPVCDYKCLAPKSRQPTFSSVHVQMLAACALYLLTPAVWSLCKSVAVGHFCISSKTFSAALC